MIFHSIKIIYKIHKIIFNKFLQKISNNFFIFAIDMKEVFQKIMAFSMAVIVLFSTMSFTVDMHFCGDTLVDTAIFTKAQTCGMEMQNATNTDCSTVKKDCCSEHQIILKGQKELQNASDYVTLEQQLFVVSFIQSYLNLFKGAIKKATPFKNYSPPLVVKEIHKLDEVYLI